MYWMNPNPLGLFESHVKSSRGSRQVSWSKLAAPVNIVGILMLLRSAACSPATISLASRRGGGG